MFFPPISRYPPAPLRTLVVPETLVKKFLQIAEENSSKKLETLGLLAGVLTWNQNLVISHLLIPQQVNKYDSCETEEGPEIADAFIKHNLLQFGWIHTHPDFGVFLSSVDMHTQFEAQRMFPETIAIVCSIKHNTNGFLRLSKSGMTEIEKCNLSGFHEHSREATTAAEHILMDKNKDVIVIDLRGAIN